MASIALVAVGQAYGWGGAALTVAGMIGSYIDQALIMPALFPADQQKLSPGKLEDLKLQSASEGTPINRCYGDATPCYGTIIWMSDLIEVPNYTNVPDSGKGGSSTDVQVSSYSYYINLAVGVCKGPNRILKIWANGKLIYTIEEDVSLSNITGNIIRKRILGNDIIEISYESEILPNFEVGKYVTLSGSGFNISNQGRFKYLYGFVYNGFVYLRLKNNNGVSQSLSPPNSIIQVPEVYKNLYGDISLYTGYDNELDALIESYKGIGNVPAYKGLCYCVIQSLKLEKYGNTIPNLKFLVGIFEAPT